MPFPPASIRDKSRGTDSRLRSRIRRARRRRGVYSRRVEGAVKRGFRR